MINTNMRIYNYYLYEEKNNYGQLSISQDIKGSIKMSINITSQSIQDNINYKDAQYMGLTLENINDSYVIQYGDTRLKVLYVNPQGRYKQVFMSEL